jgi:hypothetical protein
MRVTRKVAPAPGSGVGWSTTTSVSELDPNPAMRRSENG